jgi:transposase-like protein
MSKTKRRSFTPEQKATVLRRHIADKIPVSDLCDEYSIQPSLFYTWLRQLVENLPLALADGRGRRAETTAIEDGRRKVESLEAKLARKNEVIAEISQEVIDLKKNLGEA